MELKTNELRVGNLVYIPQFKSNFEIGTIYENGRFLTKNNKHSFSSIECAKPIPLTEEWLLNFGFYEDKIKKQSKDHSSYFSIDFFDYKYSFAYANFREDWGFYHSYTDAPNEEDDNKFDFISCGIKYVHQLQNLYFVLTNEELEIKM